MIIDIAIKEFASHDYKGASLTRIVNKAGISKGSMYQYFKNKKDLYFYLIDMAGEMKLNYLTAQQDTIEDQDFFGMYKQLLLIGSKFNLTYPYHSKMAINAMKETNDELGDLANDIKKRADEYIKDMMKTAQKKGQIRTDLDLDLMAFITSRISIELEEFVSSKFDFSFEEVYDASDPQLPVDEDELESILDEMMTILQNGMKA